MVDSECYDDFCCYVVRCVDVLAGFLFLLWLMLGWMVD